MDIRYAHSLKQTNLLGARPTQGTFGMLAARVMAPNDPFRSALLYRMAKLGRGRMPHFGSQVVDTRGLQLVHDWISSLSPTLAPPGSGDKTATALQSQHDTILSQLANPNAPVAAQTTAIAELLSSTSGALQLAIALDRTANPLSPSTRKQVIQLGGTHADLQIRELFERFLPDAQRVKRLGTVIKPAQLLALQGRADQGRELFLTAKGIQCRNCHRVAKQGRNVGPDLDGIAKKNDRRALLESILQPSKKIDPKFRALLVETVQGRVITGLLVSRTDELVVLKDATGKEIRIVSKDVEMIVPQAKSLMPELLVKDMTAQQVADLLAFLESLK